MKKCLKICFAIGLVALWIFTIVHLMNMGTSGPGSNETTFLNVLAFGGVAVFGAGLFFLILRVFIK